MTPTWIVYCHIHVESGRRYIGLTKKTLLQRWNQHLYKSKRPCKSHFWNAICKYGRDAFAHEILQDEILSLEEANMREAYWINHFDTRNPEKGFNLMPGGIVHNSATKHNPWDRPEYRAKSTPGLIARTHTPQSRANNKTAVQSAEVRGKISTVFKGRSPHPRTLQASSLARKLRYESKTHINCRKHGRVLLRDCYRNKRQGRLDFFQCKECSKQRAVLSKQIGSR